MDDSELLRYSRQIMLPEIDVLGQEKLRSASALILGLGGLGSPVAFYLAASGIGSLVLADDDRVEISNLQRQIIHNHDNIGRNKASSAQLTLRKLNPSVETKVIQHRMSSKELTKQVESVNLVIDCCDNLETRQLINEVCWKNKRPLISGAAIRWEGHISTFDSSNPESPCYRCLYPGENNGTNLSCSENGVVSPLVGIIGTTQAMEAIKLISGVGESLIGKVMYYDAKKNDWKKFNLTRAPNCPICSN